MLLQNGNSLVHTHTHTHTREKTHTQEKTQTRCEIDNRPIYLDIFSIWIKGIYSGSIIGVVFVKSNVVVTALFVPACLPLLFVCLVSNNLRNDRSIHSSIEVLSFSPFILQIHVGELWYIRFSISFDFTVLIVPFPHSG